MCDLVFGEATLRTAEFMRSRGCVARRAGHEDWSGRRESNPRMQLGKLPFYH